LVYHQPYYVSLCHHCAARPQVAVEEMVTFIDGS
jgi:hypothetical protein